MNTQCMEKGLKTLQNLGRPRRAGLRHESPTSHQSGEPTEDQFAFMDPTADHGHPMAAMAPGMPPSSFPQPHFLPGGYAPRSRGGSAAPTGILPSSASMGSGHRYSLSGSSSYTSSAAPPSATAAYTNLSFSPTSGYSQGLHQPPLPSFSRAFEPQAPAGPSLPSLNSFLSPREPISATSY